MANPNGNALFRSDNNPGAARRRAMQQAIEAEFDEPLADIIMGLREQGNSWRTVAGVLGVSLDALLQWRKELDLPVDRQDKCYDPSSYPLSPHEQQARELGYASFAEAVTALRLEGKTLRQVADLFGVHFQTVSTHTLPPAQGLYNRTEYWYRQRRQWARAMAKRSRLARRRKGHPWVDDNDIVFTPRRRAR